MPATAWTISAEEVAERFQRTQGLDPIFRSNDGSVCDANIDTSTLEGRRSAFRLLTGRGLIRIALTVPQGAEFTVAGVNNPYGCNDTTTLSMYRRPLPATNLRFLSTVMWDGRESSTQTGTQPVTGPADLLVDLAHQATDAVMGHAQGVTPLPQQVQDIVNFETTLATAQAIENGAGSLDQGGASGGPVALASQPFFIGINDSLSPGFSPVIFTLFPDWENSHSPGRASVARGEALFSSKPINIRGVAGINDVLGMDTVPGTCGTCHDSPNVGNHSFSLPINIGTGNLDSPLDVRYLPIITLRNNTSGETISTTDPGRALVTGKWADIGKVKGPVLRGLAARAPYFHNGSARDLEDVVRFYNQRFSIGLTPREQADLVAFLNSL